jgi:hypothetical protein
MHFFVHVFACPARTAACPELVLGEDLYPCDSDVLIDWHVKHAPGVGVARKFVRMTEKVDIFACHARTAACPTLILDEDLRVHATDVLTEFGPGSPPGRGVARIRVQCVGTSRGASGEVGGDIRWLRVGVGVGCP